MNLFVDYSVAQCFDTNSQQYIYAPWYNIYRVDSSLYDMTTLANSPAFQQDLTISYLRYVLPNNDGSLYQFDLPVLSYKGTPLCFTNTGVQLNIDPQSKNYYDQSCVNAQAQTPVPSDGKIWNPIYATLLYDPTPQPVPTSVSAPTPQPVSTPASTSTPQPVSTPVSAPTPAPTPTEESPIEEPEHESISTPTEESPIEESEHEPDSIQEEPIPEELSTEKSEQELTSVVKEPIQPEPLVLQVKLNPIQSSLEEPISEETLSLEDITGETVSLVTPIVSAETESELIVAEDNNDPNLTNPNPADPTPADPTPADPTSTISTVTIALSSTTNPTVSMTTTTEPIILVDCGEEVLRSQYDMISSGNNEILYTPTLKQHAQSCVEGVTLDMLMDIKAALSNGEKLYHIEEEILKNILKHICDSTVKFPLKVLVDAFNPTEIYTMLCMEVVGKPSPNGLYEGLIKPVYLYKYILNNKSVATPTVYMLMKLTRLFTRIESLVTYLQEEDEDADVESSIMVIRDAFNESIIGFREYLVNEAFRDCNQEQLLIDMCQLELGKTISLQETPFTTVFGLKGLELKATNSNLELFMGNLELSPNVVGSMYSSYIKNIGCYIKEMKDPRINVGDIPPTVLKDGISYNKILGDYRKLPGFKRDVKIQGYPFISEVEKLNLNIVAIITPIIRGSKCNKILGFVCEDSNVLSTDKYFIPLVGDFIEKLDDLEVTFTVEIKALKKLFKGQTLNLFNADRQLIKDTNARLIGVSCEFDEAFNLQKLVDTINNVADLRLCHLPLFVKNSETSVLDSYKLIGLYNLV